LLIGRPPGVRLTELAAQIRASTSSRARAVERLTADFGQREHEPQIARDRYLTGCADHLHGVDGLTGSAGLRPSSAII
jgi:hypothetical protein